MVNAIRNRTARTLGNTEVFVASFAGGYGAVMLFGDIIAYFDDDLVITLRDGGYRNATTKSRLNGLLNDTGYRIRSRKGEWRLFYNGKDHGPFENGSKFYMCAENPKTPQKEIK
jgi:hypothetical protein